MKRSLVASLVLSALCTGSVAGAQQYLWGANAEVVGGVEGGGGSAESSLRRSRSTLRLGGDVRIDESPKDVLAAAALIEMEPRAGVGFDARYIRTVGRFALGAGGIGFVAPSTLFGGTAQLIYMHPLSATTALTVGPTINVFFLGRDLPDETVVWQAVFRAGFRVDL